MKSDKALKMFEKLRKRNPDLTEQQLCKLIGIDRSLLWRWRKGGNISMENHVKIEKFLGGVE